MEDNWTEAISLDDRRMEAIDDSPLVEVRRPGTTGGDTLLDESSEERRSTSTMYLHRRDA